MTAKAYAFHHGLIHFDRRHMPGPFESLEVPLEAGQYHRFPNDLEKMGTVPISGKIKPRNAPGHKTR